MSNTLNIPTRKILSVQSHVVHGYVGNKAAAFPLQFRGWDVDALNTVQYSNHPGYGSFTGFRSAVDDLRSIIDKGLTGGLGIRYDAVLTGYLPSVDALKDICELVDKVCREQNIPWVLDPVLGDRGRLYVDMACVEMYKTLLGKCTVSLTVPNQFEMETLTGVEISNKDRLKEAFARFHELYPGVQRVVVSSIDYSRGANASTGTSTVAFAEMAHPQAIQYYTFDKIHAHFNGSGDLFSALLIDMMYPEGSDTTQPLSMDAFALAVGRCLTLTHQILNRTYNLTVPGPATSDFAPTHALDTPHIRDLKLIQCRDLLSVPSDKILIAYDLCEMH